MRIWKRLAAAAAAAIMATVLLSVLPQAEERKLTIEGEVATVFRAAPVKKLGNQNLVDSIIGQQLTLPVRKADWKQGVLSLDLAVDSRPERIDIWMGDLERLLELSFIQTNNVNRLLVRFVTYTESAGGSEAGGLYRIQAAIDVRRSDRWLEKELSAVGGARPDQDSAWRKKLRMTFVNAG